MIDDALKHLLFQHRRDSLAAARHARSVRALIDAADNAMLADDDKPTKATKRELESAFDAIRRAVYAECRGRDAQCDGCPFASSANALVDGRTLCEAAADVIADVRREKSQRMWLEECKRELSSYESKLEELRERHIVEVEERIERSRADLDNAQSQFDADKKRLAELDRKYGVDKATA